MASAHPNQHAPRAAGACVLVLLIAAAGRTSAEPVGFGELKEQWRGEVARLSWQPRAYVLKGFLSDAEADHIISLAEPKLEASQVVDHNTGEWKNSDARTSTGAAFGRSYDPVLRRIEKRIASVTMLPVEHQEGLQVLRYVDGQRYEPHLDAFNDAANQRRELGGQRVLTFLMYLAPPEEGGETVFVDAERRVSGPGWSECALQGLAHKPAKGDALMWYSLRPDGQVDTHSIHGSCPTLKGVKYVATKYLRVHPFAVPPEPVDPLCNDQHEQCEEWAFMEECDKSSGYMHVHCRKACKLCVPHPAAAGPAPVLMHGGTDQQLPDTPAQAEAVPVTMMAAA